MSGIVSIFAGTVLCGCGVQKPETEKQNVKQVLSEQNQNVNKGEEEATANQNKSIIPLPSEISIVQTFFTLINEHRSADAVSMLSSEMVGGESQKQAWGVQFNAFESVKVMGIEESMKEEWTDLEHSYKVTLDVQMAPESFKAPVPNYGYQNGNNIRWVGLKKEGDLWKINSIATGP